MQAGNSSPTSPFTPERPPRRTSSQGSSLAGLPQQDRPADRRNRSPLDRLGPNVRDRGRAARAPARHGAGRGGRRAAPRAVARRLRRPISSGGRGRALGAPCVAVTNFTWDWIYEPYAGVHPWAEGVVETARQSYRKMEALLQLPFGHPAPAFREVIPVPLVARRGRLEREDVLSRLPSHRQTIAPASWLPCAAASARTCSLALPPTPRTSCF